MYRQLLVIAAAAATTFAQIVAVPELAPCAKPCIQSYGGCPQTGVECICSNKPFIANLACCVGHLCDAQGQADVLAFADSLCKGYGVTDLPQSATCAPGAASTPVTGSRATELLTSSGTNTATTATASAQSTGGAAVEYAPQGVGLALGVLGVLAAL